MSGALAIPYAVVLAPLVIYAQVFLVSYLLSRIEKTRFWIKFRVASDSLYVFMLLLSAPLLLKINIPDPHNFPLRKLELLLGAAYAGFVLILAGYFLYRYFKARDASKMKTRQGFMLVFVFAFAFYFSLSLWFNYANQPTGDEPEYLMMAQSMAKDGDLDLSNNYAAKEYTSFYNKELVPQGLQREGRLYSYHPFMVSAVMLPFYAVMGRSGATLLMNALCALIAALSYILMRKVFEKGKTAIYAALAAAVSLPLIMFSNMICSESLSGALLLGALCLLLYEKKRVAAVAIVSCFIPWAHPRNILLWLALGAIAVFEYRKEIKNAAVYAAAQAASGALLLFSNYLRFGSFMPGAYTDTARLPGQGAAFKLNAYGIFGLLFDQEFGLLFYTPVFALFAAGLVILYRNDKKIFWYCAALFFPYYAMLSSYSGWSGGGGASPRFFVPVIFLFTLFAAAAVEGIKDKIKIAAVKFLLWAGFIVSLVISMVPWFRWNKGAGDNWILKFISGFIKHDLTLILPSFWSPDWLTWPLAVFWLLILILVNIYFLYARKNRI
jgi:hypothetical protein